MIFLNVNKVIYLKSVYLELMNKLFHIYDLKYLANI